MKKLLAAVFAMFLVLFANLIKITHFYNSLSKKIKICIIVFQNP